MGKKRVLIVGGGTGGHISPGISLYEECMKRGVEAYMLVGTRDKKFKYLSEIDSERLFYYGAPSLSKNILKLPILLVKLCCSFLKVKSMLKKYEIEGIVGMGGYVSGPALLAAKILKIPVYLCEQNTVPGKVTLLFAKYAEKIFTTFDSTKNYIKDEYLEKIFCAGNPVRKKILEIADKDEARKHFNLQHCDKIILTIGGSQGAVKLNELVLNLKLEYPEELKSIGIIWCTGKYSFETYRSKVYENSDMGSIYMSPFIEDVGMAYNASDIAIARSGAGVMVELAAKGIPSILVPYPNAASDHQNKNADEFVDSGASIKIHNDDARAEIVGPVLFDILNNSRKLDQMGDKAVKKAKIDAAQNIINMIVK
jgi:UDP-N-acetylglucosamine--N-acetylmuramyl-(pentapeptide) pyrophosphoryl-undecaprenol N-acetylglucosamine transferase